MGSQTKTKTKPMNTSKITVLAASLLALAATASAADMSSVKLSGFAAVSYQYAKTSGVKSVDSFFGGATSASLNKWGDAAKIAASASSGPISGMVSLFYYPNAGTEFGVLDAYLTYDAGSGWTVKVGKYLSPLGLEAFNIPDMVAITYGPTIGAVPAYHSGVEVDYSDKEWGAGLGLVDSIYAGPKFFSGDTSFQGNKGLEGYVTYKGIEKTVLWAGFSYEGKGGPTANTKEITVVDFWASYQLTKEASIAAEWVNKSEPAAAIGSGSAWEIYLIYAFDDKLSTTFRVGDGDPGVAAGPNVTQYTVSPSYKVNDSFLLRAELSYYSASGPDTTFFGLQGVFKF
jgi:Putative beta-barrel porin-2, OmpL-like. bbp2